MTNPISLVEFLPRWRSRSGMRRYAFHPDSGLERLVETEAGDTCWKTVKNTHGLLLRPVWPSRRSLVLAQTDGRFRLHALTGGRITPGSKPINLDDPSLAMDVEERGLFRTFRFTAGEQSFAFHDLAGRLVGPRRTAFDIFPEDDFSPFARLIGMLRDDRAKDRLLSDFARHRFKYVRWIDRTGKPGAKPPRFELLH